MKKFRWVFLLLGMVATSLVSGCLFWHSEPDVIVWKTEGIPQEWVERQIKAVEMKHGLVTTEVGVAGQFNENGYGESYRSHESFLLAAAYNKRTGAFSAEWGYAPNPEAGHNGIQLTFVRSEPKLQAIGTCMGKHPVAFELEPDFTSLTMLWGARFEDRGRHCHRVTWQALSLEP